MKKQLAFFAMILLLLSFTSATLCKASDGYYYDCYSHNNYHSNYYSDYDYSYESHAEYNYDYNYHYNYYSNDYSYSHNSRNQFRPSEYLWEDYPEYNEYGDFDYDRTSFRGRSLYDEIFFYR
jgi:hypothetical protein